MRIIRPSEYRRMPWKNGGGETVEIAVAPAGASLDGFDWRVSMAHVASGGPFSRFPGIDRTLAVLEGAGICLSVAAREAVPLRRDTPPFGFSGDDRAEAELIDGAVVDLNVMTRRASHRHRLVRLAATAPVSLRREGDWLLVVYPEPEGFGRAPVRPAGAYWHQEMGEFVLPYDRIREDAAPDERLLEFCESTYAGAADLARWNRAELERGAAP